MSNATVLPTYTNNKFFFWNAKLTNSLDDSTTAQTVNWDTVPVDENGATITGSFLIACRNTRRNPNRTEMMYVPAAGVAADGLSATSVIRGLKPSGIDFTTGSSSYVHEFDSGDEVFCAILPQDGELIRSAIQGIIASGAVQFIMGADASATVTHKRSTGVGTNTGFLRWDSSTSKAQFSNDGSSWVSFDSVSASNLVQVSAADTTPNYLTNKIDVATSGRLTKAIGNPAAAETVQLTLATTLTDAEMNSIHTGISANVTGTNLATLTAGASSNADALHTHATLNVLAVTAYEAVTADDAVCILPVETQWYNQLTDVSVAIGQTNQLRRRAVKYIPTASGSLTDWNFRAAEQVNGATTLGNLLITIETDSAGSPSGTALTNATATISQVTQRTWNTTIATRTATFGGAVSVTAGTTYWVVYAVSATDAANYLKFGANDTYAGNYLTFTSKIFDLDTASWGSSSTTSIPFGWSNTTVVPFGYAVVPTDADFGARTWNFIGFATTTVAAQASVNIETDIANLTGLTPNTDYWISSTAGQITTTRPSCEYQEGTAPTAFAYKIGRSLSTTTQLKVRPGAKRVPIREATLITATTTRQYIIWFKPEYVKLYAYGGDGNADGDVSMSVGRVLADGSDNCVLAFWESTAGGPFTHDSDNTNSISVSASGGNTFKGSGSTFTNAGFSYLLTEAGTADVSFNGEAIAD